MHSLLHFLHLSPECVKLALMQGQEVVASRKEAQNEMVQKEV